METETRPHPHFHVHDAIFAQPGALARTVWHVGDAAEVAPREGRIFPPRGDAGVTGRLPPATTSSAPLVHATRVDDPKGAT